MTLDGFRFLVLEQEGRWHKSLSSNSVASKAAHSFKVYCSIVCKRNTLGHTNRITRLQGALREYLRAVIRRCLKHNHTNVWMLALGGDSVD